MSNLRLSYLLQSFISSLLSSHSGCFSGEYNSRPLLPCEGNSLDVETVPFQIAEIDGLSKSSRTITSVGVSLLVQDARKKSKDMLNIWQDFITVD